MNPNRLVWLVTDQVSNHRAMLAFAQRLADGFGDVRVVHVHVPKDDLVPRKAPVVRRALHVAHSRWRQSSRRDAVLLFRDTECRSEDALRAGRDQVKGVVDGLRTDFEHTFGLAFNPMSEAAFLLFDQAIEVLRSQCDEKKLRRVVDDRRGGRMTNKDLLDDALGVASAPRKRALDDEMARVLFGEGLPRGAPPFDEIVARIRATLRASLSGG